MPLAIGSLFNSLVGDTAQKQSAAFLFCLFLVVIITLSKLLIIVFSYLKKRKVPVLTRDYDRQNYI
jgi:Na+/H+ antiporter NhaD/arsenite permease-like protein